MPKPTHAAWKSLCGFLLAVPLMAVPTKGQPACQREIIRLLTTIVQRLGNSSDATLYTPEDSIACFADNLSCFTTELQVIQKEHDGHAEILSRLRRLDVHLTKLMGTLRKRHPAPYAKCPPCEAHPELPVPVFLSRLQQQLQRRCRHRLTPPPVP